MKIKILLLFIVIGFTSFYLAKNDFNSAVFDAVNSYHGFSLNLL